MEYDLSPATSYRESERHLTILRTETPEAILSALREILRTEDGESILNRATIIMRNYGNLISRLEILERDK